MSVAIGPVCASLDGLAEAERTAMGRAVRVFPGGAELARSGAGLLPAGISGALDARRFGVGNGVDGLETNGVGPRDTHGRALDSIGAVLRDTC